MRLTAIDLDGTLLTHQLAVQSTDAEAIRRAQKRGLIVAIATGRSLFDARHILAEAGLSCPVIASNGAEIYVEDKLIFEEMIPHPLPKNIIEWLFDERIYCQVYYSDQIVVLEQGISWLREDLVYVSQVDPGFSEDLFWKAIAPQIYQYGLVTCARPKVLCSQHPVFKIMVVSPVQGKLLLAHDRFRGYGSLSLSSSGAYNLEIMAANVNKGTALTRLCQHYRISLKESAVIGDNRNDLPMFKVAGLRIAMGNAHENLMDVSDLQTLSVDACGVAYALEHYISITEPE